MFLNLKIKWEVGSDFGNQCVGPTSARNRSDLGVGGLGLLLSAHHQDRLVFRAAYRHGPCWRVHDFDVDRGDLCLGRIDLGDRPRRLGC